MLGLASGHTKERELADWLRGRLVPLGELD